MEAFRWVAYGFSLFAAAPVSWALLALVGGVVYALPFAVPVLGVVLGSVALPGFYAALVLAAESADHLEPVRIAALGDAWDWRRTLSLLRIGLAQLLVSVFVGLVATYADQQLDKVLLVAVNLVLALYFLFAHNFLHNCLPHWLNIVSVQDLLSQVRVSPQPIAPMNQVDLLTDVGQV